MNLILCCTMYQLMNAINLMVNHLKREETDLLLNHGSNFDRITPVLEELKIFRHIYHMPRYLEREREFRDKLSPREKSEIGKKPERFMKWPVFDLAYEHLYTPIDDVYGKMLYYYLLNGSSHVNIHYYEDGLFSYVQKYSERMRNDGIPHSYYGKKAYAGNIVEQWLYEPKLFCGERFPCPLYAHEKLSEDNKAAALLKDLFMRAYHMETHSEEPFIFFVEAFIDKFVTVDDVPTLERIAETVGKENICVKLHPREPLDRFSRYGYKVKEIPEIPWEAQLLCDDYSNMAVVSFSSTANLTAKMAFDRDVFSVYLYRLPVVGANYALRSLPNFGRFLSKMMGKYADCGRFFAPGSFDELRENLLYIGGMIHG